MQTELYEKVTNTVLEQLEKGVVPWVRPWRGAGNGELLGLPHNAVTGNSYSGVNIILLWIANKDYPRQAWLTYKQAQSLGGNVRKGEKGAQIVYADSFISAQEKQDTIEKGRKPRAIFYLKAYTVFNTAQCEGLPERFNPTDTDKPLTVEGRIEAAENVIKNTGADFCVGSDKAFYEPLRDRICVPHISAFDVPINYYRTAFHELGHWTGHESRLDRKFGKTFGSVDYAKEELVAEMCAAFTCASLSIQPTVRHADYIGSWITVLQNDNKAVVRAASAASKAYDYILRGSESQEEKQAA